MVREGGAAIVNPLDLYAVELSLLLRERHGGEVTGVSMGPAAAERALREVLSMGCDDAVLLCDRAFAGSDTWATALVLSAAVKRLGPFDLVICGERATDGETGQVGPELAAFLDLPVVTYAAALEAAGEGSFRARRLVEEGYETVDFSAPAVVTVVKEVAAPRLPTLRGKQRAKCAEIPTWGPAELELDPESVGLEGSPTRVERIFRPKIARGGEILPAADPAHLDAAAARVVEVLAEKGLA